MYTLVHYSLFSIYFINYEVGAVLHRVQSLRHTAVSVVDYLQRREFGSWQYLHWIRFGCQHLGLYLTDNGCLQHFLSFDSMTTQRLQVG